MEIWFVWLARLLFLGLFLMAVGMFFRAWRIAGRKDMRYVADWRGRSLPNGSQWAAWQPVGLWNRRLRNHRDGPFFIGFLPHSSTMRRQIRQKLRSSGWLLAIDDQSPTGCWVLSINLIAAGALLAIGLSVLVVGLEFVAWTGLAGLVLWSYYFMLRVVVNWASRPAKKASEPRGL